MMTEWTGTERMVKEWTGTERMVKERMEIGIGIEGERKSEK